MGQLSEILPHFVAELAAALEKAGHSDLAASVRTIEIHDRCTCQEPGCVTFFAIPKAKCPPPEERGRVIPSIRGVSCVQHSEGKVVWIEALGRPEERRALDERLPTSKSPNTSFERTRER